MMDVLAEFYQNIIKPEMASKKDLERFATKKDLERFATKEDLNRFATKEDLIEMEERLTSELASKSEMANLEIRLISEIKENTQFVRDVEASILSLITSHEKRIKGLEEIHPQLSPLS